MFIKFIPGGLLVNKCVIKHVLSFILGSKQYAYLRLLFDLSNVPSNYYTAQWQTSLQNVIFHTLLNVSSSTPSE